MKVIMNFIVGGAAVRPSLMWEDIMAWKTPKIREICIGMEINAYMPSEL